MFKKVLGLCLVLALVCAPSAYGQKVKKEHYFKGQIKYARPVVFGDKSAILLTLKERTGIFVVKTVDGPKFGLLKPETAAAPDKDRMAKELEAAKGWKVRLTFVPGRDPERNEYQVQNLERLSDK